MCGKKPCLCILLTNVYGFALEPHEHGWSIDSEIEYCNTIDSFGNWTRGLASLSPTFLILIITVTRMHTWNSSMLF